MKSPVRAFVTTLITVGVVLGAWRVLGKGAAITDPAWFANAQTSIHELWDWANRLIARRAS